MDPTHQILNLFITYVDKEGPFLKVWGQAEKNNSIYVEQFLLGASQQFEQGIGKIPFETLQVGTLVCAKYKDNKYYRSRIVTIDYLNPCFVEVSFLDYGNKDIVPSENIRSLQNFPTSFISIPPLATGFIFAEAHCPGGGEWKDQIFEIISKELRYREVQCHLLTQATQYYLIKLYIDSTDIGALFISRGLMQPIPLHAQQAVLLSMSMQRKPPAAPVAQVAPPTEINTYKACTLEPMQQYAVYVSFVNEGPTHFSVQLQQSEHMLAKLMKEINEVNLRMMDDIPLPGAICLARCQEDGNICRAVVTNEVDNMFKVFYVDFGNYETLPLECLYQIPFKYVLPKVMAIRLALNGVEKSSVTMDMLLAFKKYVDNRLLHMKVLPSARKTVITKCELWDPETKTSALDVINRAAQHAYPEPLPLNRGFTQPIKVSYVFSCNRFFVQLSSKEPELAKLMEDLQLSCQSSEAIYDIKIGLPCCALFEGDQLWYRSEIMDVVDKENVKVRYIDYGNEEIVPVIHLRMVEGELLTVLRPQAIECCLNGYQNMGADETRDALLEELILEQSFTMKVSEMLEKKALVELFDASNYNVASLLLEKIAASKSQVSPMLVQAGNTLEHRKTSDSSDSYRPQRKPARDWARNENGTEGRNFDKSNEKSWRNENKDTRQNEMNSNDGSPDGSWRQNNKGFNRNEKNDRDTDRGDRNQRGERSTASNINDRFAKNRNEGGTDNKNNNWKSKENGFENAPSWSSPVNDAAPPASDGWGDTAPSPVQNSYEDRRPRDDKFGGRKKFEDRGDREDRGGWKNKDGFKKDGDREDRGGWKNKDGFKNDGDREDRGGWKNKDGFKNDGDREDRGGWKNKDGFKNDGFKKDFRKSRLAIHKRDESGSGSEHSFKKGPRTSSRNDFGAEKRFSNRESSFANSTTNDSWSVSDVSTPIDAALSTATFDQQDVVGNEAAVVVSWFHNPGHFYCQLQSGQPEFKTLMEEIQQFYKNRKPEKCVVGAPVVGLFPEDNVLYRAQILKTIGSQYKVFFIDFGNVSEVSKVWPIEKKFMVMPAQAVCSALGDVAPNGENWPDPSAFSSFFSKEFYMARFLEKDEARNGTKVSPELPEGRRNYVQLWDNQEEVSQLLIQANLAVASVPQTSSGGIEVALLLNQQFRVILKSVNNLSDIIVALECGLAITCKAHNLEMASESYEDVLKGYLEQPLIVYVDNILQNDLLDVTFYDNDGNKLVIVSPDEGALDNVEPLCPILIISSQMYGYVSHANETSVFIQPTVHADQISALLEQMYEAYENITEEASIIPEEGFVYAVHSADGNWYRGRVDSFDDENATVSYVDYGNSESVAFSEIKELKPEFNLLSIMCLQVNLATGSAPSFLEKSVLASIYYGETGWEGTVQEYAESTQVDALGEALKDAAVISVDNGSVPQEGTLVQETVQSQENGAVTKQVETVEHVEAIMDTEPAPLVAVTPQKGTLVYVSHIDSPTQFYVQFTESTTALDELQLQLQTTAEEMTNLENISVGVLCAAPYSLDQQWYRAEVLDADEDITTVRFVDYGNTDVIDNQTTKVKTLPTNLLSLAVYATRCSLMLKAVEEDWSQQAIELFEGLANGENVAAEFIIQDEKTNIVELYSNGENIKDVLLAHNLAVPCEIVTESKTTCFVSHLNSPSEFWVQMENCVDELEWIAEQLSGAEQFPELEDMSPGTLCAALFPDDEMWYRARILSNTIAGIELLFIDYGNSSVSSSLRQLPEELVITSPLAQKCCLQRPDGIPYWTKEAQDKFSELSAEGQTIFELKKVSTGETATVELILNGDHIVPRILPVTEDGIVKDFETLEKFNVEKNGELLPETVCLEPMPGMEWDNVSNEKFLKLYPNGTVFQVELIGEDCVRLYRDGADIRPNLGGVKSNLNLSNTQDDKTDNLAVSEDHVIDYEAGGDNLDTKHSIEDSTQDDIGACQEGSDEIIGTTSTQAEKISEDQGSGPVDICTTDTVKDNNSTKGSETDSGHHSELDNIKEDEKDGADDGALVTKPESPKKEDKQPDAVYIDTDKPAQEQTTTIEHHPEESKTESRSSSVDRSPMSLDNIMSTPLPIETHMEEAPLSRPPSSQDDNKTSTVSVLKSDSPLPSETEPTQKAPNSRPSSSLGRRLSHDDKILPASASRPQTPLSEIDPTEEAPLSRPSSSQGRRIMTIEQHPEKSKTESRSSSVDRSPMSLENIISTPLPIETHTEEAPLSRPLSSQDDNKTSTGSISKSDRPLPSETEPTQKASYSRPSSSLGRRLSHDDKILLASVSRPHTPLSEIEPTEEAPLSRPSSSQGRRVSHDDKIVPGGISRPQTPIPDDDSVQITERHHEQGKTKSRSSSVYTISHENIILVPLSKSLEVAPLGPTSIQGRRPSHDEKILSAFTSIPPSYDDKSHQAIEMEPTEEAFVSRLSTSVNRPSHDDKIIPSFVSRPHSVQPSETEHIQVPLSGSPSSLERCTSHDNKILSAFVSIPHSPQPGETEHTEEVSLCCPSSSLGLRTSSHDDKILPASVSTPHSLQSSETEHTEEDPLSRPSSSLGLRTTSNDDNILPASVSRPFSPKPSETEHTEEVPLGSPSNLLERRTSSHDDKILPASVWRPHSPQSSETEHTEEVPLGSPSSSLERRTSSHDDKILPASVWRPHSPQSSETEHTEEVPLGSSSSSLERRTSSHDDKILPASVWRPHSPQSSETEYTEVPLGSPSSSLERRTSSHDDKILPASVWRPHSPQSSETEHTEEVPFGSPSGSLGRRTSSHDDKILPASVWRPHSPQSSETEYTEEVPLGSPSSLERRTSSHDDKILSGSMWRPHSLQSSETQHTEEVPLSRPSSLLGRRTSSHDDKILPASMCTPHSPQPSETEDREEVPLSMPSSLLGLRTSRHDDKILPASVARPHSPQPSETEHTEEVPLSKPSSSLGRRTSSHDDNILPASVSRPQPRETELAEEVPLGRPSSSLGRRTSCHDDKILPASVARPHSPQPSETEHTEEVPLSKPSSSLGRRTSSHDDNILPASVSRPQPREAELTEEVPLGRPSSSLRRRTSCHDDKILPAFVSRAHNPQPSETEHTEEVSLLTEEAHQVH